MKKHNSPASQPLARLLHVGLVAAILFATFFSFLPVLTNQWTNWDDDRHLLQNPTILQLDWGHVVQIFATTVNKIYIPLTSLTFTIEHAISGFKPFLYHFDNLLLHMVTTVLIYFVCLRLGLSLFAAVAASLLFGIHPMHVESVAWVTERKDVLYAFFYLLAMHAHWSYRMTKRYNAYVWSVIWGVVSILAKPMALSLPLILLLLDWVALRRMTRRLFLEKIPHFILLGAIAWLTYREHIRVPGESVLSAFLIWGWSFTFYIKKFFIPIGLVPLYHLPRPVDFFNFQYAGSIVFLSAVVWSLWRWRNNRWYIFAWGYYFLSIFFILRFDDVADVNIVADRFMYLPSVGFCMFIGWVLDQVHIRFSSVSGASVRRLYLFILVSFALALSFLTFRQAAFWKNSITLWSRELLFYPDDALALNSRGAAYHMTGQLPLALADLTHSLSVKTSDAKVYNNRGLVYTDLEKFDLALQDFNQALALNSKYANAYNNRGIVYDKTGHADLALADFNQAVLMDPSYQQPYNNRGVLYKNQKKLELALQDFQTLLKLNPNSWEGYYNCGNLYVAMGEYGLALIQYNKALLIKPAFVGGYLQRANLNVFLGNFQAALSDYTKILELKPNHAGAYYQRSQVYWKLGNRDAAQRDAAMARQLGSGVKSSPF